MCHEMNLATCYTFLLFSYYFCLFLTPISHFLILTLTLFKYILKIKDLFECKLNVKNLFKYNKKSSLNGMIRIVLKKKANILKKIKGEKRGDLDQKKYGTFFLHLWLMNNDFFF